MPADSQPPLGYSLLDFLPPATPSPTSWTASPSFGARTRRGTTATAAPSAGSLRSMTPCRRRPPAASPIRAASTRRARSAWKASATCSEPSPPASGPGSVDADYWPSWPRSARRPRGATLGAGRSQALRRERTAAHPGAGGDAEWISVSLKDAYQTEILRQTGAASVEDAPEWLNAGAERVVAPARASA